MTGMVSVMVYSISSDSRYGVSDGATVVMTEIVPVMAHSNSAHDKYGVSNGPYQQWS